MTTIIPITEMRDTNRMLELVRAGPVFVTKNGHGSMVVMSIETYNEMERRLTHPEPERRHYRPDLDGDSMSVGGSLERVEDSRQTDP